MRHHILARFTLAMVFVPFVASGQQYTAINLGPAAGAPGNSNGYGYGYGINASGQVTGAEYPASSGPTTHAFITNPTTNAMVDLGTLGGFSYSIRSFGYAINDAGQVTGTSAYSYAGHEYAFVTDAATRSMVDLGTLGGQSSVGNGINDTGQVAGTSFISGGRYQHAFLYNHGVMQDLGTLGGTSSYGYAINASGQVTGGAMTAGGAEHAFLTDAVTNAMGDLGTLPGYTNTVGTAVNAGGQVTGYAYSDSISQHAFITDAASNTLIDIGSLGGLSSQGLGINASGQVVGWAFTATNTQHGFLYSNGQMLDLNALLTPSDAALYTITSATAINDSGQIVANGYVTASWGQYVALLLTPMATADSAVGAARPNQ